MTGSVIGDGSLFDDVRGGPSTGGAPDIGDLGGELSALTYDHGATQGRLSPAAFADAIVDELGGGPPRRTPAALRSWGDVATVVWRTVGELVAEAP